MHIIASTTQLYHCDILKVRMYVLVLIVKYCMTQHREDESTLHDETDDISANPISALDLHGGRS